MKNKFAAFGEKWCLRIGLGVEGPGKAERMEALQSSLLKGTDVIAYL